jgi:replicative DNA helicase
MDVVESKALFCRPTDERALIYYALQNIEYYFAILSKISSNDFLYDEHVTIMYILSILSSKNVERFEVNAIISEASAQGILESIGGVKYIQVISRMGLAYENFEYYLDSVIESIRKYKLHRILLNNTEHTESNSKSDIRSEELLARVETDILDLSLIESSSEPQNLSDGLIELIEERADQVINLSGTPTGYPILDTQLDGLIPGTLTVVAARKKKGKSTLLSNIALNIAIKSGIPTLYIDTEMSFKLWRDRCLACVSGVKERDIRHGGYSKDDREKLNLAAEKIASCKIFHEQMPGYSVDRLIALYKKYKVKEDIGFIVFDYLKEPESGSIDRERKEYQILGDVTTKLKDLASVLDVPALTAVQLNRNLEVADSDRIARYADVVCNWENRTKEELKDCGPEGGFFKLEIRDTRRGGQTNEKGIGFHFFKPYCTIGEVPAAYQYFTEFDGESVVDDYSAYVKDFKSDFI